MKIDNLTKAIQILETDGIVAIPTETVYGLAARIDKPAAIKKIFQTKERPFFDPLIVHVSSIEQAKTLVTSWPKSAEAFAKKFWPGPLTLVLPKSNRVDSMITSGLANVGVRMPHHSLALELIEKVGVPLAAPSANKFGKTSPTTAAHVLTEFQNENIPVLDGGPCQVGIESTVLLIREDGPMQVLSILRKGHVLQSELSSVLEQEQIPFEFVETTDKKESPGHMKHHYMPEIPFFLIHSKSMTEAEILNFANQRLPEIPEQIESVKIIKPKNKLERPIQLTLSSDPTLACREFYSQLREISQSGADCLYFVVERLHQAERWEGLIDRMSKAASLTL